MPLIIEWPICVLRPTAVDPVLVAFSRGARSLGGVGSFIRTDLGFWEIAYGGIIMPHADRAKWQTWQAIRSHLGGKAGLVAVRVKSAMSAPFASGKYEPRPETLYDDDTLFDDDTPWVQGAIAAQCAEAVDIGETTIKINVIHGSSISGTRFSYRHALYEIGRQVGAAGDVKTVQISPSIRAPISEGADLEFDEPTCLCHLKEDRGMSISQDSSAKFSSPSVVFEEATDYWNALAKGEI